MRIQSHLHAGQKPPPPWAGPPTIFSDLCDVCNELDRAVLQLDPGPVQDAFEQLVARLDAIIDRTIGLEVPEPQETTSLSPDDEGV
jgi:hypothetical protein